ncbi:heterogeneous nuclear ribonucleoprotein U-like protein 2 isoform X2 [Ochlerotatus camptorhynchus]|uniref:heterogeneous nuclear ribonucleoprotein U-like protein 2 isoform X2 n=1 Tax=Ochlerotatus camptorhynchus TaxID=644619 RepID=UPI0031D2DEF1
MDYNKMKVNDLKAELATRSLDTKGVKAVLVERLKEAIEKENSVITTDPTTAVAAVKKLDAGTPGQSTPVRRSRRRSMTRSPSPSKTEVSQLKSVSEEEEQVESADLSSARKKRRTRSITKSPTPARTTEVTRLEVLEEELDVDAEKALDPVTPNKQTEGDVYQKTAKTSEAMVTKQDVSSVIIHTNETKTPKQTDSPQKEEKPVTSVKLTEALQASEATPMKFTSEGQSDLIKSSQTSETEYAEVAKESESKDQETNNDEQQTSDNQHEESSKSEKHSSSSSAKNPSSKTPRTKPAQTTIEFVAEENEPTIDNSKVLLSWFDSDLNLEIDPKTFDVAKPFSEGALSLLWAAARANLGATMGKIAFEVILTKTNELRKVTEEPVTSEFRVGWSVADANLQLGEAKHSFAYASTGSKGTDSTFTDYGSEYKINDVLGVYLDLDSSPCKIEYTVNNVKQGTAFEFQKVELEGKALYPHVCSRNIAYKVNFGQLERSLLNDRQKPKKFKKEDKHSEKSAESSMTNKVCADADTSEQMDKPAAMQDTDKPVEEQKVNEKQDEQEVKHETEVSINPGYIYIAQSPIEKLVLGPCRPESRNECELIFLIGLPASGKTHWVQNYARENTHKKITILSVETLLDQMRLSGEPRKPANTKKWSRLVDQLSKSLNKLTEIAAKRRKNFIFDQTNVFPTEQKRKLRGFGEYAARRAVIVVPDEEEHKRRIKQKYDAFGAEVPEQHLNVMKAHFHIPSKELNWFTEITYAELDEEKAIKRVKELNAAGQKALPRGLNKNQQQRRGTNNNQGWNQGNKRYSGVQQYNQGGYNPQQQRYNSTQQYSQNRHYRPDGGYGRRDSGGYTVGRYGSNNDWTRGRYENRYNNRGSRNSQAQRYGGNYSGYNSGSGWNQPNSNCWSYGGNQGNDTQQWYSWWQQQGGVSGGNNNSQQANMEQYWSQYTQQRNYGNYQQSKSQGSGSSKNK